MSGRCGRRRRPPTKKERESGGGEGGSACARCLYLCRHHHERALRKRDRPRARVFRIRARTRRGAVSPFAPARAARSRREAKSGRHERTSTPRVPFEDARVDEAAARARACFAHIGMGRQNASERESHAHARGERERARERCSAYFSARARALCNKRHAYPLACNSSRACAMSIRGEMKTSSSARAIIGSGCLAAYLSHSTSFQ